MNTGSLTVEVYNSVGGAAFFRRLLDEWESAGRRVLLMEAVSETDYRRPRGVAGRLMLRWRMYGGFAWRCWREARGGARGAAVRVVTTNPFFAPSLVAWAAGVRAPTIHLLYDLYPEALVQAGVLADDSRLARCLARITRHALRECAVTVFLGDRLKSYAEKQYGPARRGRVIPVGADGVPFRDYPPTPPPKGQSTRILYAGQMGRMHDTETLRKTWMGLRLPGIEWVFHASGAGYRELRERVGERSEIRWGESLSDGPWQTAMRSAQVALVTIAPGAERVVMPSKTYSAMVAGQAVLAICALDSDLADLVKRHDCGWVVEPGDIGALRTVLLSLVNDPAGLQARRERAYAAGHRHYDMQPLSRVWLQLFDELQREKGRSTRI